MKKKWREDPVRRTEYHKQYEIDNKSKILENKRLLYAKKKEKTMTEAIKKSGIKKGDIVIHNDKQVLVQKVIDYCPEMRKSYVKGCAIDSEGRPLLGVDVFPGYDWKILR